MVARFLEMDEYDCHYYLRLLIQQQQQPPLLLEKGIERMGDRVVKQYG